MDLDCPLFPARILSFGTYGTVLMIMRRILFTHYG